jgi:hypothetical protein
LIDVCLSLQSDIQRKELTMPIRITAGIGKKLGLPAYSSKQASVQIEAELAEERLQHPEQLQADLQRLFAVASRSVDEQLRLAGLPSCEYTGERTATPSQVNALWELARAREIDLESLLNERYFRNDPDELTVREAGELINWLQANPSLAASR